MKHIFTALFFLFLLHPAAADPAFTPYLPADACTINIGAAPPCIPPSVYPNQVVHGDFMVTSPESDADAPMLPNFWVRTDRRYHGFGTPYDTDGSPKSYARGGMVIHDKDDSPELAFRAYHDGPNGPEKMPGGHILGRIYGQDWTDCAANGKAGWYDPCEDINDSYNRPVDMLWRANDDGSGDFQFLIRRSVANNATPAVRFFAAEPTGVQTPIGVWVNGAGGTVFRRVEVGPANGCGTGYSCLRIPNR